MNQNILEKNILGELMALEFPLLQAAVKKLKPFDFNNPDNKKIFKAIAECETAVETFELSEKSGIDLDMILEIENSIATTANLDEHTRLLRNSTIKRKVEAESKKLLNGLDCTDNPTNQLRAYADKVINLSTYTVEEQSRRTALDDIQEIKNSPSEEKYSFGVTFLDDALNGINNKDTIIGGSKTGHGKTQLACMIAETNARNGKKVLFLALEAEQAEIGSRIKFRNLCTRYFTDNPKLIYPVSFDKWLSGQASQLNKYNSIVEAEMAKWASNILVQYRANEFTIDDLNQQFNRCKDVDLIILDHIHYIDILDNNENKGLKNIIKCIRANNLFYKKPIIVIAHLRKTNKKDDGLVPDTEDLHGSSDLAKIATKIVLFAPSYSLVHDYLYPTYFRVCKCRRNSSPLKYVANLKFDPRLNSYQEKYKLGEYRPFMKEFECCDDNKLPEWFKHEHRG